MLTVSAKALGRKKPLFADFSVAPPAATLSEPLTLRALLRHIVTEEVEAFRERQAERRLLHVLSAQDLQAGLEAGKVFSGGSELDQKVDTEEAIQAAIVAFQDGLYMVVLDETELKSIDQVVTLNEASRLTFIRLSLLAGG
ncbi:MAG: hypothetical protein ACRC8S_15340 [Fimbriiglobus sp.]